MLDSLDVGIATCDAQGQVVLFNQALRQAVDADADPDRPGWPVREWVHRYAITHSDGRPVDPDDLPIMRALRDEPVVGEELLIDTAPGRRLFAVDARPIDDPEGSESGQ